MAGIEQIKSAKLNKYREDIWLVDLLDEYLGGTMDSPRSGVFHPSTLSNKCDRAVWLIYHGQMVSSPLEAVTQRIFQNGDYLEKRVEKWLTNLRILVGREIPVKFEFPPMSGRMDFLIKHELYGIMPIELKSINTSGFSKLTTPKEEHQLQLQMYLNMGNYEKGTILYENKNDQKLKSFIIEKNPAQWDSIIERCFKIQNMPEAPEKCTGARWCACRRVEK
jgi:hypothetical protein